LRRFLIFRSAWLFAVGMVIPYYTVYLLQNLKLSFTEISVLTNIGALAGLLSTPLWGKVLEMYGCSRVIFWTSLVKIIYVVAWAFVVPGDPFLPLIALHISLVTDAGMTLAASNLLMNLMPAQDAGNVAYFSVFIAITSVVSAGAPFLAGLLIGFIGHSSFAIFGFGMGGIQLMFLASGVLRLLSMLLWGGFADKGIR
jgi:MFS family permease